MAATRRNRWLIVGLLAAAVLALAVLPLGRRVLWSWESNAVLRGRLLAEQQGCYNCHQAFGSREIPNPGSRWGSVPRLAAGNSMMYASDCEEIGEYIRFGAPRAWLDDDVAAARLRDQRLRMPAYGDSLSDGELSDLKAFACAVEGVGLAGGEAVAAGRALAKEHGCLACHGVEASGGLANPGSLGGFIPGFAGRNFPDLVSGEGEFREWVATGTSRRLEANPVVRYFWRRQAISMPAYGEALDDVALGNLWRWVEQVRGEAVTDATERSATTAPEGGSPEVD